MPKIVGYHLSSSFTWFSNRCCCWFSTKEGRYYKHAPPLIIMFKSNWFPLQWISIKIIWRRKRLYWEIFFVAIAIICGRINGVCPEHARRCIFDWFFWEKDKKRRLLLQKMGNRAINNVHILDSDASSCLFLSILYKEKTDSKIVSRKRRKLPPKNGLLTCYIFVVFFRLGIFEFLCYRLFSKQIYYTIWKCLTLYTKAPLEWWLVFSLVAVFQFHVIYTFFRSLPHSSLRSISCFIYQSFFSLFYLKKKNYIFRLLVIRPFDEEIVNSVFFRASVTSLQFGSPRSIRWRWNNAKSIFAKKLKFRFFDCYCVC